MHLNFQILVPALISIQFTNASTIAIQAESGSYDPAKWELVDLADISGTAAPLNTALLGNGNALISSIDNFSIAPENRADYSLNILSASTYSLWARVIVTSSQGFSRGGGDVAGGNDSFFFTDFDGDATSVSSYSTSNGNDGVVDAPQYLELLSGISLAVGTHTFSIVGREDGLIYDGFIVSDETFNASSFDSALNVVPEPGTAVLLGFGCLACVFCRRKA